MTPADDGCSGTHGVLSRADEAFMREALAEAKRAEDTGDVPIGAVITRDGVVIARAGNRREADGDPTAHAEILALREAAQGVGAWRLEGCTLYVTLEPCFMCAGAVVNARVDRIVFAAADPKAGAVGSLADVPADSRLNHNPQVTGGVLAAEASAMLKAFFRARRKPSAAEDAGPA